jgi:hypothetical protein
MNVPPRTVALAERVVTLVGFVLLIVALVAVDWRLGAGVAGVLLLASTIEVNR